MKVLIVHNILWAHYKSILFESIYKNSIGKFDFKVIQIAKNEISRKSMETDIYQFDYPYELLFDEYFENINWLKKTTHLLNAIYKYNPDIINLTGYATDISISISIIFAKILGKKIVISNESTISDNKSSRIKNFVKKQLISLGDYFITFGKTSKEFLQGFGVKESQIIESHAAVVDNNKIHEVFLKEPKINFGLKNNFVYVGRFIENKNLFTLLKAYSKINKPKDNWGLVLVGDGHLKDALKAEVLKLKLENVTFVPAVTWMEVPRYYTANDVLVLSSISEAWGLVVNEAMICGLPIIISNKCGCYKDLADSNGYVFDIENPEELTNYMNKMMSNEILRLEMGKKSQEIIKKFNVDEVGKRICNEFVKIA